MDNGYVLLHRKLFSNKLWLSEKFTKAQAWIDLFANANHTEGSFWVRGNEVKIKRGQLGWSELNMAQRWCWSRSKVRRFLWMLEMEQQIVQQKSQLTTVITILNYDTYQKKNSKEDNRRYNRKTTDDTTDDTQTMNDKKMINNDKKDTSIDFPIFWNLYPKKVERKKTEAKWKSLSSEVRLMILEDVPRRVLGRQWREGFIPNPMTYLNGERWTDEIRTEEPKNIIGSVTFTQ